MVRPVLLKLLIYALATFCSGSMGNAGEGAAKWRWWRELEMKDLQGQNLEPESSWLVAVFISEECPVSNASIPTLNRLRDEFGAKGFHFVGAYCDPTQTIEVFRQHRESYELAFDCADDRDHRLVDFVGARYTPEAFVFDAAGTLLYRGRIDNRVEDFGISRPAATRRELRDVLVALSQGQSGPFPFVSGFGCSIPQAVE